MGVLENTNLLMAVFCVLAAALLILSIHMSLRVKKLEKRYRRFMKGKDALSLEQKFNREFGRLDILIDAQSEQKKDIKVLQLLERKDLTRYGIVKYDAFEDVGGKLSFALALLNDEDTGFVLNAIHSKDNCFLYLKEIVNGESYIMLSNEEIEALQAAKNNDSSDEIMKVMSTEEKAAKDDFPEEDNEEENEKTAKKRAGRKGRDRKPEEKASGDAGTAEKAVRAGRGRTAGKAGTKAEKKVRRAARTYDEDSFEESPYDGDSYEESSYDEDSYEGRYYDEDSYEEESYDDVPYEEDWLDSDDEDDYYDVNIEEDEDND